MLFDRRGLVLFDRRGLMLFDWRGLMLFDWRGFFMLFDRRDFLMLLFYKIDLRLLLDIFLKLVYMRSLRALLIIRNFLQLLFGSGEFLIFFFVLNFNMILLDEPRDVHLISRLRDHRVVLIDETTALMNGLWSLLHRLLVHLLPINLLVFFFL